MGRKGNSFLFVLEYYYPHLGGVEVLFQHTAEGLTAQGHKVTVLTMRVPGAAARETRNGVEIVRVPVPSVAGRYFFMLLAIPYAILLARRADLVHTTTYNAAVPAWLASRCWGLPSVITVHEVFADQWHRLQGLNPLIGFFFRFYEWVVLSLPFTHMICDCEYTRRRLRRHARVSLDRASVVYPAVDYSFWRIGSHKPRPLRENLGLPANTPIYFYFGRPGISKGVEDLISAAVHVKKWLPEARLVMLLAHDPKTNYRRIRELIERLHLKDHVVVHDPVPRRDLPGYLLAADCVVVPSISEGFGYAAVEAATIGCRVIATTGHSVEEVIGKSIIPTPPRAPEILAATIAQVLMDLPAPVPAEPQYDLRRHLLAQGCIYRRLLSMTSPETQSSGWE